jgi:YD repeat-containing protein
MWQESVASRLFNQISVGQVFRVLCLVVSQIIYLVGNSQIPVLNNVVSPSPNAAALAKHAEISTDLHTGVPVIQVPIHTITSKSLSWPISLTYHSAGNKVGEVGGMVGLGWSLAGANAVVTRVMRGRPDEAPYSYFHYASTVPDETATVDLNLKKDLADGLADMLPDFFYYNTGTSSGRIIFDNQLAPRTIPRQDVKVTISDMNLGTFNVIEPDGTIFQFSDAESSSTYVLGPDPPSFKSTWYITRIISADRSDTIKFNYTTYPYSYNTNISAFRIFYYNVPGGGASRNNNSHTTELNVSSTTISGARILSSIEYHGGKLVFQTSNRTDDASKKLDVIIVYYKDPFTSNYVEEKRINFTYGYFQNEGQGTGTRLRLDNVREQSGSEFMPPFEFIYSTKKLPAHDSPAQDLWGYYNGMNTNDNLIPEAYFNGNTISSNDRNPNSDYSDACILSKIISPLDGETEYVFESNDYLDGTTERTGPGLRVKKIINRDPFSTINAITNFEYKRPSDNKSSGKLTEAHPYITSLPVKDFALGGNIYNYDGLLVTANPSDIGNFVDSPVVYEYVTTYVGDSYNISGKSITKFSYYNPATSGYPFLPSEDNSWAAGQVLSQENYKVVSGVPTIVSKTVNTYLLSPHQITIKGLKVAYNKVIINLGSEFFDADFELRNYLTYSKFQYLSESKTYVYEENSSSITSEQTTNFYIDNELDHTMPVRIRKQTSDTNVIIQDEFTYPADYSTGVFIKMKDLNIIGIPVDRKTFNIQGSNDYLVDYSKTDFLDWGSNNVYPQYTHRPKITTPTLRATFNSNPGAYLQKSINLLKYSEFGKPLESKLENGQSQSVVIDSYHQSVIASCSPAAHNQIAYTGFETPYRGQWVVNQGSSQQNGNVALSLNNPSASFEIHASQSINYNYSVTRTSGASPTLTFSKVGATPIVHTLSLTSGSGSASLTPGIWVASIDWGINVTAMSVTFSYQYTYWNPLNISSTAKTGLQSLSLQTGNSITKTGLPAGDYVVSYYQKNGTVSFSVSGSASVLSTETNAAEADGWSLIRKNVRIVNTTDGLQLTCTSCLLDELRLQPMGSFMNTQSFDRQGRLRTETDQNYRSQYFEYDVWGRLKMVRDNDRNIVQHYEYKFASN